MTGFGRGTSLPWFARVAGHFGALASSMPLRGSTLSFNPYSLMSFAYPAPPLAFLRRRARAKSPAHGALRSLPDYLEGRAALLRPEHLQELARELPLLRLQFAGIDAPRFPHLPAQLKLLADLFQDSVDARFLDAPPAAQRETALALRYVAHNTDAFPDHAPGDRHADDSLLVRTVLRRHRKAFRNYCRFRKIRWSTVTLAR